MLHPAIVLVTCLLASGEAPASDGVIGGVVVNAVDQKPVAGADVVLRLAVEDHVVPLAQTTTGKDGKFLFRGLRVGSEYEYQPGANRAGVHYPGPHLRLSPRRPVEAVRLEVRDAITHPSPLRVKRHDVLLRPEPGMVTVTETMLVENPTEGCYVGRPIQGQAEPITLALSIPSDFDRVTFAQEFFGRRFSVQGKKVVTSIPWTPGERELKFTYTLANPRGQFRWERPLDLPTSEFRVIVETDQPQDVLWNLADEPLRQAGRVVFACDERALPAGQVVRIEIGRLPVSAMAYARWMALAILVASVTVTALVLRRRRNRPKPRPEGERPEEESCRSPAANAAPAATRRRRRNRASRP